MPVSNGVTLLLFFEVVKLYKAAKMIQSSYSKSFFNVSLFFGMFAFAERDIQL